MHDIAITTNINLLQISHQLNSLLDKDPKAADLNAIRTFVLSITDKLDQAIENSNDPIVKELPKLKPKVKQSDSFEKMLKNISRYFSDVLGIEVLCNSRRNVFNEMNYKHLLRYYFRQWMTVNQLGVLFNKDHTSIIASIKTVKNLYSTADTRLLYVLGEINKCLDSLGYSKLTISL